MSMIKFLCFEDNTGARAYLGGQNSYLFKNVSDYIYELSTEGSTYTISVDPSGSLDDYYFFVSKEAYAINWVRDSDSSRAIGVDKCS
jgi:hypothetical protein